MTREELEQKLAEVGWSLVEAREAERYPNGMLVGADVGFFKASRWSDVTRAHEYQEAPSALQLLASVGSPDGRPGPVVEGWSTFTLASGPVVVTGVADRTKLGR